MEISYQFLKKMMILRRQMQKDTYFSLPFGPSGVFEGLLGGHLLHNYSAKCVFERGPGRSWASREARPGQARPEARHEARLG